MAEKMLFAWQQDLPSFSAEESGLELGNEKYKIKRFDGPVGPKIVDIISTDGEVVEEPQQG